MPDQNLQDVHKQSELRYLQLMALLEVTQAINSNLTEQSLYKIYHFTLIGQLQLSKLALYVKDEEGWECKVHLGTKFDFTQLQLPETLQKLEKATPLADLNAPAEFKSFKQAIPIIHNFSTLACVLVDNARESAEGKIDLSFIETVTNIVMVAIENKRLARRQMEQEAMRKELEIAKEVQNMLFPKSLPNTAHCCLSASYLPHHSIGGDYYDYIAIDKDSFLICVADVSGKGVPASILMSNFQASLRTLLRQKIGLVELVRTLNVLIYKNAISEKFITAFFAVYNQTTRSLSFVNAGHNPPILLHPNCTVTMLSEGCTMLGIIEDLPFVEEKTLQVVPGSFLLCYTDGLTEVFNNEEEEYGEESVIKLLQQTRYYSSAKVHEKLLSQINTFKRDHTTFDDDITLLSCRFK